MRARNSKVEKYMKEEHMKDGGFSMFQLGYEYLAFVLSRFRIGYLFGKILIEEKKLQCYWSFARLGFPELLGYYEALELGKEP